MRTHRVSSLGGVGPFLIDVISNISSEEFFVPEVWEYRHLRACKTDYGITLVGPELTVILPLILLTPVIVIVL